MILRSLSWLVVACSLVAGRSGPVLPQATSDAAFLCPPCGAECHFTSYTKPGKCGVCGMALVPFSSVPQVGVLLTPDVGPSSFSLPLMAFAASSAVRVFTVADSTQPLRCADVLEVVPQFALADAPALDVLVVPATYGALDDALIIEWVKGAAQGARFVLAVDVGSILLGQAGALDGVRVPVNRHMAQRGKELAPKLEFDTELRSTHSGKFRLVRDALGSLDAALEIVGELSGEERARATAKELGYAWTPEKH